MMSHYPSTAELAAFRRSIRPSWYAPREYPADLSGLAWPMAPIDHEPNSVQRRWGMPVFNGRYGSEERRRAGVLRTRAYAAAACPVCGVANIPDGPGCDCYGA